MKGQSRTIIGCDKNMNAGNSKTTKLDINRQNETKKGRNMCLPIVLSVRLSSYIRKIKNFTTNTINFKNTNLDRTHRLPVKTHKVLKYYLTEMSLISNLDSYNIVLNTFLFLVENISCEQCRVAR